MGISIDRGAPNIGREDRLIRACVALSLFLMGSFAMVASHHVGFVVVGFALLTGYFAWTALVGWDPLYQRAGIDTRSDAPEPALADGPTEPLDGSGGPASGWGGSLLGN